jgi:hypothetical protein
MHGKHGSKGGKAGGCGKDMSSSRHSNGVRHGALMCATQGYVLWQMIGGAGVSPRAYIAYKHSLQAVNQHAGTLSCDQPAASCH